VPRIVALDENEVSDRNASSRQLDLWSRQASGSAQAFAGQRVEKCHVGATVGQHDRVAPARAIAPPVFDQLRAGCLSRLGKLDATVGLVCGDRVLGVPVGEAVQRKPFPSFGLALGARSLMMLAAARSGRRASRGSRA
jgi:hypothetical protein